MDSTVIDALTATAWRLAEIQIEGVQDNTGFSNADKNLGAMLASIVSADPSDEDNVRRLAALVGGKYQRQVGGTADKPGMVSPAMLASFKKLAKGTKVTKEDRLAARMTVLAQPNVHPKFGPRILFAFQYNQDIAYALRNVGGRPFQGADGWKWAVRPDKVAQAVADMKALGAKIIGDVNIANLPAAPVQDAPKTKMISARIEGKLLFLSFAYDRALVDAVKEISGRKYYAESKEWSVSTSNLATAVEILKNVGADVSELIALAGQVAQTVRPVEAGETEVEIPAEYFPATTEAYQRTGIEWLVAPLNDIRAKEVGGETIRGKILGDKPGLGKTMQAEIAARAIVASGEEGLTGRVLVVGPSTSKLVWVREIKKFCGDDQKINVITGTRNLNPEAVQTYNGADPRCTWNIINYDILQDHYEELIQMGFDVLILDEAHYIKNHEAERSKIVVGGNVSFPQKLSDAQGKEIVAKYNAKVEDAKEKHDAALERYQNAYGIAAANGTLDEFYREFGRVKPRFKKPQFTWPHKVRRIEGLAAAARKRVFPLTGTPMANRPKDIFNLLKAIGHPLGNNFKAFAFRYCNPETIKVGNRVYTQYNGSSNLAELRQRIDDVFLQRFEVPGIKKLHRTWTPVEIDLAEYHKVMREFEARRKAGELSSSPAQIARITQARVCAARAMVPATIERAEIAMEAGDKVLIFSMYTQCIDKLKAHFGNKAVVLDGRCSAAQRKDAEDRFQNDDSVRVFIGQGIAAGQIITLTAGTQVKINDLDWVPATHIQSEKRAHRKGQTQDVFVEYMVAAGTFYEDLATMLEEKLEQVNDFEGTDVSLFEKLFERLATAPKNEGVRQMEEGPVSTNPQQAAA